jgi:hypothetical protein
MQKYEHVLILVIFVKWKTREHTWDQRGRNALEA